MHGQGIGGGITLCEQCEADKTQLAMAATIGLRLTSENADLKVQCKALSEEVDRIRDVEKQQLEEIRATAKNAADGQDRYLKMTAHCRRLEHDLTVFEEQLKSTQKHEQGGSNEATLQSNRRRSLERAEATDRVQELEIENKALRRELTSPRREPNSTQIAGKCLPAICHVSHIPLRYHRKTVHWGYTWASTRTG